MMVLGMRRGALSGAGDASRWHPQTLGICSERCCLLREFATSRGMILVLLRKKGFFPVCLGCPQQKVTHRRSDPSIARRSWADDLL